MPNMTGSTASMTVPVDAGTPVMEETIQWYAPHRVPNVGARKPAHRKRETAVKSRTKYCTSTRRIKERNRRAGKLIRQFHSESELVCEPYRAGMGISRTTA